MPGFLCCILRLYIYNTVHQLANERHRMAAVSSSFASCLHKYESLITPRHSLSTAGWAIYASANTAGAQDAFKMVTTVTARLIKMRTVDLYRFSALMYVQRCSLMPPIALVLSTLVGWAPFGLVRLFGRYGDSKNTFKCVMHCRLALIVFFFLAKAWGYPKTETDTQNNNGSDGSSSSQNFGGWTHFFDCQFTYGRHLTVEM